MRRRGEGSMSSRRSGTMGSAAVGEETGLPLIWCPECDKARVLELRVKNGEHAGRVFFKCPKNYKGVASSCQFYMFQRRYLEMLVDKKYIKMKHEDWEEFEEVNSREFAHAQRQYAMDRSRSMETDGKLDQLISVVKIGIAMLCVAVVFLVLLASK